MKKKIGYKGILLIILGIILLPLVLFIGKILSMNMTIWGFLAIIILIFGYIIPSIKSNKIDGPLSKKEKELHPFNQLFYMISGTFLVILLVLMYFSKVIVLGKVLETILLIILGGLFVILTVAWILTDIIRKDFPYGIARVIGRILKLVVISLLTVFICSFIIENKVFSTGIFMIMLGLLVVWLAIQLMAIFSPFFISLYPFISIFDSFINVPTYEDIRIFKLDDNEKKIYKDGKIVKLKRVEYSNTFVDKDGNQYKEQ